MQSDNFTQGSIVRGMLRFSVPYLITCFLQTFYGIADLFIVGQFNEAASITAVSVGSQLMHMLTVVIAGFAMGSTVLIGRSVGAGNRKGISAGQYDIRGLRGAGSGADSCAFGLHRSDHRRTAGSRRGGAGGSGLHADLFRGSHFYHGI